MLPKNFLLEDALLFELPSIIVPAVLEGGAAVSA